jgi:hypothetical protein
MDSKRRWDVLKKRMTVIRRLILWVETTSIRLGQYWELQTMKKLGLTKELISERYNRMAPCRKQGTV